jgi:hypothetical protein
MVAGGWLLLIFGEIGWHQQALDRISGQSDSWAAQAACSTPSNGWTGFQD